VDFGKLKQLVNITEFREVKEEKDGSEMTHTLALTLKIWYGSSPFPVGKRFMAAYFGLGRAEAPSDKMILVACEPLQGISGTHF
jgi:hypothetical protein